MNTAPISKNDNILVGLDIGTTKICVIVAKKAENNKVEIIGSGVVPSRGVQDGEVKNIRDTYEDIAAACELASTNSGVPITKVFVGIAGAHVRSNVFRLGYTRPDSRRLIDHEDIKMLEDQVKNLTNEPGEKIISYQHQEFYIDQKIPIKNNPIGVIGNRLEASWHVITGNESSTYNIEKCVDMAGLKLVALDLEPLASAASVLTKEQLEEGVCLIDIGGGTTDIAIFTDGIIRHTAIIPYAGEYITKIIQSKLKLKYDAAKKLKESQNATSAMYSHITENKILTITNLSGHPPLKIQQRYYCRLINACMEHIFTQVKNEIQTSFYHNKLNAGIVITGGGAMIPDLKHFVEQFTGLHTQIGHPTTRLSGLQNKDYAQTIYATSIGLALLANENFVDDIIEENELLDTEQIRKDTFINSENITTIQKKSWMDKVQNKLSKFLVDEETFKEFDDNKN